MVRLSELEDVEFKIYYDDSYVAVDYTERDWSGSHGRELCSSYSESLIKFIKSKLESSKKDSL